MTTELLFSVADYPWQKVRTDDSGVSLWNRRFMVDPEQGSMAHLTYQESGYTSPAHFHWSDQFQVILDGDAKFANHHLVPLTVHYVDKETAYGPIVPGANGVVYGAFRRKKTGIMFMKDVRAQGVKWGSPGREYSVAEAEKPWQEEGSLQVKRLLGDEHTGPWAEFVRYAPHSTLAGWRFSLADAEVQLVVQGSCSAEGRPLECHSLRYLQEDAQGQPLLIGPEGATILFMGFDRPN